MGTSKKLSTKHLALFAQLQFQFQDGIDWKAPQENTNRERRKGEREGSRDERQEWERGRGRNVYKHSGWAEEEEEEESPE